MEPQNLPAPVAATPDSPGLIVRSWSARATREKVPAYLSHLSSQVFPALQRIAGYRGGLACESMDPGPEPASPGSAVHIQVLTFWESLDAVRAFAGQHYRRAIVEPAAQAVLLDFDDIVRHFEVRAAHIAPAAMAGAGSLPADLLRTRETN